MENNYSIKELVKGIKAKDNTIFRYIYKKYFPMVSTYVLSNSGSENDAKDIFQETIIILYKNIVENNVQITSEFSAYLFSISKKIYLKKLEIKRRKGEVLFENELNVDSGDTDDAEAVSALKNRLLYKHFKRLGEKCQQILKMFAQKIRMEVIAKKMGFSNANYAKKRKHVCQQELIDAIKTDVEYQEIMNL